MLSAMGCPRIPTCYMLSDMGCSGMLTYCAICYGLSQNTNKVCYLIWAVPEYQHVMLSTFYAICYELFQDANILWHLLWAALECQHMLSAIMDRGCSRNTNMLCYLLCAVPEYQHFMLSAMSCSRMPTCYGICYGLFQNANML